MSLKDKEILVVDKKQTIMFLITPQLKTRFLESIARRGNYNTYTQFFIERINAYIKETEEMINNG